MSQTNDLDAKIQGEAKDEWTYCGQRPIPKALQKTVLGDFTKHEHTGEPCQCGFIWSVPGDYPVAQVISGEWGDEYPAIRIENPGAIGEKAEPYMEKIVYGSVDKATADANIRLMVQAPAMLALLERWAKWHEGFLNVEPLNNILNDTRNLLKEAKEVKHGKH